jgi:hypothetical protein
MCVQQRRYLVENSDSCQQGDCERKFMVGREMRPSTMRIAWGGALCLN